MEAIICDRCGKHTNRLQGTTLTRRVSTFGLGTTYDLCPDCANKFHEFMNPQDFPEKEDCEK